MHGFGLAIPITYITEATCLILSSARFPLCDRTQRLATGYGKDRRSVVPSLCYTFSLRAPALVVVHHTIELMARVGFYTDCKDCYLHYELIRSESFFLASGCGVWDSLSFRHGECVLQQGTFYEELACLYRRRTTEKHQR